MPKQSLSLNKRLPSVRNDKRTIFGWAMYDWANSAYITIFGAVIGAFFTGTIMPGDTYWGLSGEALFSILIGIGSIVLMLSMPVLVLMFFKPRVVSSKRSCSFTCIISLTS